MLMPQSDRKKIYEHLFEDGVCIAKKDYNLKSHPEIKGVKNLYVVKALKSLASRGLVKEQFAWRHYYFYLSPEGITYLREYLGLPEDVFPATHRQPKTDPQRATFAEKGVRGFKPDSDRGAYRGATDKVAEAGPGAAPITGHRAGFGRGPPPPQQ
ncbi:plectin/S10 domain-containing protein [Ditylenchus destructor]|uniref:Plectin/S10 domain-containing protein n=1 Tax=Ditylenchus destructor TaxID=166010 RepID=A0AAD4RDH1_9BILA|nr:plectin/S10 domain-containing protein [Ditylenchus destructor]